MGEITVYLMVAGTRYDLSESAPLEIIDISNLGATNATRITERAPSQDGDSDLGRVLNPRSIPIILQARPNVSYPYATIRRLINQLFKAGNADMQLGVIFDDDTEYRIDVRSIGNVQLPLNIENQALLRVPVTLRAATPIFYDPVLQIINFGLVGAGATLVPTVIPMLVGGSTVDQTAVINYDGSYLSYPIITITGPLTNPKIENLTTGLKLDFTGITITAGNYYTIDLRFGRKQVYKNGDPSDNRINELTSDSSLAFFAILPDPDVPGGINQFKVTGTVATSATSVYVQYYRNFDGI
jgi:hypothetical protein